MADRVSAAITLGGTVTTTVFAGLCERIAEAGLSTKWDGAPFESDHLEPDEPLVLYAHEVADGQFPELEAFCVENTIAFARWAGACTGAFAAERVVFPGAGEPRSYTADEDDHVLITRDTVEALASYEAVIAYFREADFTIPPLIVEG